jgi:thiamine biosynthesis lipoprotein
VTAPTSSAVAADLEALGVQVRLVVTDPAALRPAAEELSRRLAELDLVASRFRADSELRRLDDQAGRPTPISPLLATLLRVALRAARLTDGDVDPTLGAALCEAGYDRDYAQLPADGPAVRLVTTSCPGWRSVHLDLARREVTVPPGVLLDLGATAKAWAADAAADALATRFECGVLVGLGGDVAMAGAAPDGGWSIRVQDVTGRPDQPPNGSSQTVLLRSGGLATSSVTARRWTRGGVALHHILDPRTGLPARSAWRTVSVAAASCVDANIASTWAIVRPDRARNRLSALGLPARLVAHDSSVVTVGGWPAIEDCTS